MSVGTVRLGGDSGPRLAEITAFLVKAFTLFFIWSVVSGKGSSTVRILEKCF